MFERLDRTPENDTGTDTGAKRDGPPVPGVEVWACFGAAEANLAQRVKAETDQEENKSQTTQINQPADINHQPLEHPQRRSTKDFESVKPIAISMEKIMTGNAVGPSLIFLNKLWSFICNFSFID